MAQGASVTGSWSRPCGRRTHLNLFPLVHHKARDADDAAAEDGKAVLLLTQWKRRGRGGGRTLASALRNGGVAAFALDLGDPPPLALPARAR